MRKLIVCIASLILMIQNIYSKNFKNDFTSITYNFSINYAPASWKKEHLNWDLKKKNEEAFNKFDTHEITSLFEYQNFIKNFFKSIHDYHVNVCFYRRDFSYFPIKIKSAEGRYFIDKIFFNELETLQQEDLANYFKLQPGLEILEIDGIFIHEYIKNIIKKELGEDYSKTGYALATAMIFERYGYLGHVTPSGTFSIKLKDLSLNKEFTLNFTWFHKEEEILQRKLPFIENQKFTSFKDLKTEYTKNFSIPWVQNYLRNHLKDRDSDEIIETSFFPPLGEIIWLNPNFYYAYIYKNKNKEKIGFLRINDFMYFSKEELKEILKKFKNECQALVIDITNNPGGALYNMYETLSLISNKSLTPPLHILTLTQKHIFEALEALDFFYEEGDDFEEEDKLNIQEAIQYFSELIDAYKSGKKITNPLYLLGINKIEPNSEVMFNKPILILINELDFSCGDFFPAIAQDNQLAILLGERTAGAGGAVEAFPMESECGVQFYTLTTTLGIRSNGRPIENLGVEPDIHYEMKVNDITHNYEEYIKAINNEVSKMIKNKK